MNYAPPSLRGLALDRDVSFAKSAYRKALKIERAYAVNLRKIARHIADLVRGFDLTQPLSLEYLRDALERYADILGPWAESTATRMVKEAASHDEKSWRAISAKIGKALEIEIATAPTGQAMRSLINQQVGLITSLPREAAERVHTLVQEGMLVGQRPATLAKKILETGEVTKARANLIARTETARAAATLKQVRAQSIGSVGYIWKTTGDSDVRPSHRAMRGQFVRWDDPPTLDGMIGHAGCLPNCRCRASPVLPKD